MKRLTVAAIITVVAAGVFTGCGNSTEAKDSGKAQTEQADTKEDSADKADEEQAVLEDGTYTAEFKTDSSMFHVNAKFFRKVFSKKLLTKQPICDRINYVANGPLAQLVRATGS